MKAPARVLTTALAVNAALLLGCTALQNLQGTKTNQPAASGSPTATATPIGAGFAKSFDKALDTTKAGAKAGVQDVKAGVQDVKAKLKARKDAALKAIDDITPAEERAIGQAAAINIIAQGGGLVLERNLVNYVNDVANFVGSKGKRRELGADGKPRSKARRFFVGVLNDPNVNAYTLPGGYILVTRGLLEKMASESELAWVLGHEIAHVDHEHGLKALKIAVGAEGFFDPGSSEQSKFDDPAFFMRVADKLANIAYKTGMDKETELVADKQGLDDAVAAGYDSRGAKRVLDTLTANLAAANAGKGSFRLFESHDTPARRLEVLGKVIDSAPNGKMGVERYDQKAMMFLEAATVGSGS